MTIKQLLNMSVDKLEAMTDAELNQWCEPYKRVVVAEQPTNDTIDLELTSPDNKPTRPKRSKGQPDWVREALALAQQHNVSLPTGIKYK